MSKETEQKLRELVEELLSNGDFFYSAIEQGTFDFDFTEWKAKAEKLVAESKSQ